MKKFLCGLLAAVATLSLVACVPSNMEKAEKRMKKEGYTVIAYTDDEAEGLIGGFNATKSENFSVDNLTALLFESSKEAKAFYKDMKNKSQAIQEGKWVYWGTEDAIEDFED